MRLWPCPFSHAMADSLHCLDGTGPASAARSNGPLRTTLAVYVLSVAVERLWAQKPSEVFGSAKTSLATSNGWEASELQKELQSIDNATNTAARLDYTLEALWHPTANNEAGARSGGTWLWPCLHSRH